LSQTNIPARTEGNTPIFESRSRTWSEGYETTKTALFRVHPSYAVLQHLRTVTVSQRAPSTCEIDVEPRLADVPAWVVEELRETGRDVVAPGGSR
jgi:hypothetical protein